MKRTFVLGTLIASCMAGLATPAARAAKVDVPLPPEVKAAGYLTVGVNCTYPPAGYIDIDGKPAGYEITLVKEIADYAFGRGSGLHTQCVNDSNRISFLQSGKIDLLLASLAYTPARAQQLDYSEPIWVSNLQLVVPRDSKIASYADLDGKTVATTTGSTYQTWLQKCYPKANLVTAQTASDAATLLTQKRADAFAYIDVYGFNFTKQHPGYKVVGALASPAVQGVGVKKGNTAMLRWTNAVLEQMRKKDDFYQAFAAQVKNPAFVQKFRNAVPGPDVQLDYKNSNAFSCTASN